MSDRANIMVVISQMSNEYGMIRDTLEKGLKKLQFDPQFDLRFSQSDALERLEESHKKCDIIITKLNITKDSKTPLNPDLQLGMELLQTLHSKNYKIPCILLTEYVDDKINSTLNKLGACKAVKLGSKDWDNELLTICQMILNKEEVETKYHDDIVGKVDVYLDPENNNYSYQIEGPGYNINKKPLILDEFTMNDLASRSRKIGNQELNEWQNEFHTIGTYLLKQLFEQNSEFNREFEKVIFSSEREEKVRLRFIVEERFYPIALEALIRDNDYWMLHSHIYRTVLINGIRSPLFKDEETRENPINCLIINANTEGLVILNDVELKLFSIENAKKESHNLEKYLKKNKDKFNIGKIKLVTRSPGKQTYKEFVKKLLSKENGPWHLVHFAGHSYYDKSNGKGLVFFPGTNETKQPESMEIDDFARLLRLADTRFIYLSSCQSSETDFAFELARQQIPSIVGFRWDIEDDDAAEHAGIFYQKIFEQKKSLENAFLDTRKEMHDLHKNHRVWAAAILIIQSEN